MGVAISILQSSCGFPPFPVSSANDLTCTSVLYNSRRLHFEHLIHTAFISLDDLSSIGGKILPLSFTRVTRGISQDAGCSRERRNHFIYTRDKLQYFPWHPRISSNRCVSRTLLIHSTTQSLESRHISNLKIFTHLNRKTKPHQWYDQPSKFHTFTFWFSLPFHTTLADTASPNLSSASI